AEQQGADLTLFFRIAEAADDAGGGALLLDLDHRPLAWTVGLVEAFGDHAVQRSAAAPQPAKGRIPIRCRGRQEQALSTVLAEEMLERPPSLRERITDELFNAY